jgi:molybdenum cofactor biosynthesis enzyme MoaA
VSTPQTIYEQNRGIVRTLVWSSGVGRLPPERVQVHAIEDVVDEAAVDLELSVARRLVRLRISPRDEAKPAFGRTASFNLNYIKSRGEAPLEGAASATLDWVVKRLAAYDQGNLMLGQPSVARPKNLSLPMASRDEPLADRVWQRALFDGAMDELTRRGTRTETLVIVVSNPCAMNCTFCPTSDRVNVRFEPGADDRQREDLIHQLERGRAFGATTVDFGGNDVLLFPGIVEVFEAAGRAGYTTILAQSPGQALADRAFAEAVAKSPLTHVAIPIYGTTAAVHDAITRKPGTFDGLMRALENVRELGSPKVELHTIALKSTLPLLEELIPFCKDRLDLPLRVACLRSNRQGERSVVQDMPSFTELRPLMARYRDHFRAEFPPCQFPRGPMRALIDTFPKGPRPMPINLYDLGLPNGCEDALVALERTPLYPARCEGCAVQFACCGVQGHYLDLFGDEELSPYPAVAG